MTLVLLGVEPLFITLTGLKLMRIISVFLMPVGDVP
jgi:hypothetical protein